MRGLVFSNRMNWAVSISVLFGLGWLNLVGLLITFPINCINASGERLNFANHSRIFIFLNFYKDLA